MKRFTTILLLLCMAAGTFAQVFVGVPWVAWENEPDYTDVTGYADNPYDNPLVVVPMAPEGITPDLITNAATFDLAWSLLGDSMAIANLTSNGVAGDIFDLGSGTPTFGAAWKGVHDGANFYVMLKYWDVNSQVDEGTRTFEIMAQPTSHIRHEPTFLAAGDSTNNTLAYQNMAYARYVELGGGKAAFSNGQVTAYEASAGLAPDKKAWIPYVTSGWVNNEAGLLALASATHFWNEAEDGTIRAIMVMSFDGALAYPADPADPESDIIPLEVGDTIAFDAKSNSAIGGTENDNKIEYFWSADRNNGYASNFYSGHVVMAAAPVEPGEAVFVGVPWVAWENEPDYEGMTGYAANPYDNPEIDVLQAPDSWSYDGIADAASFDATWDILGDSMAVANLTSNGVAGDLFDLGSGTPTFGAAWKGVHDGTALYVFLKYWDVNAQVDEGTRTFEIMAQPTLPVRHEPTFLAAGDSTNNTVAYQNMAYARYVELGGGKAAFSNGQVTAYEASVGLAPDKKAWIPYVTSGWVNNEAGLLALASASHFWNVDDAGTIRAAMVMTFDGALVYPADPADMEGDFIPVQVGETIAFDVKSNSAIGGTENDNKIEYFWSADKNNGYASNYYSGHVTLSNEQIVISGLKQHPVSTVKVFISNDNLHIRGVESTDVKVYSITGSLVKSAGNVSGQLDLGELNDGVYLVKLGSIPTGFKVVK